MSRAWDCARAALRAALSALGVAIGIAAMVAVLGISDSSKAGLVAELNELGTNLLTVAPGQTFLGEDAQAAGSGRQGGAQPRERALGRRRDDRLGRQRATQPLHRSRRNQRHQRVRRRSAAARARWAGTLSAGASSTRPTNAIRWSCSAPSPRERLGVEQPDGRRAGRCRSISVTPGSRSRASSARSRWRRKSNGQR